ncbi:MAG TPA: DUF1232 domain-containing protein [Armatimonadota bacterium]|jgi:uncharacterized membrane protein YkvA (DUF1232 family)
MAKANFTLYALTQRVAEFGELARSADGRRVLRNDLAQAIGRSKINGLLLYKVRLMYDYFRDPAEPMKPKILIGGALLYLVVPNDLIPDWIPLIGFADDFAAIAFAWKQTSDVLLNYEARRQQRRAVEEG